jgi:hypothetical protein
VVIRQPGERRALAMEDVRQRLAGAVRAGNGSLFAAGAWRWGISGPCGTIIINARDKWPHRALRQRIREKTGVVVVREKYDRRS